MTTLIIIAILILATYAFFVWQLKINEHHGKTEEENEHLQGDVAGLKEAAEILKEQRNNDVSSKEEADAALKELYKL